MPVTPSTASASRKGTRVSRQTSVRAVAVALGASVLLSACVAGPPRGPASPAVEQQRLNDFIRSNRANDQN